MNLFYFTSYHFSLKLIMQDSPTFLVGLVWEDVEGQENIPVSAGFKLTTHELLVQEHNYSESAMGANCRGSTLNMT